MRSSPNFCPNGRREGSVFSYLAPCDCLLSFRALLPLFSASLPPLFSHLFIFLVSFAFLVSLSLSLSPIASHCLPLPHLRRRRSLSLPSGQYWLHACSRHWSLASSLVLGRPLQRLPRLSNPSASRPRVLILGLVLSSRHPLSLFSLGLFAPTDSDSDLRSYRASNTTNKDEATAAQRPQQPRLLFGPASSQNNTAFNLCTSSL